MDGRLSTIPPIALFALAIYLVAVALFSASSLYKAFAFGLQFRLWWFWIMITLALIWGAVYAAILIAGYLLLKVGGIA